MAVRIILSAEIAEQKAHLKALEAQFTKTERAALEAVKARRAVGVK